MATSATIDAFANRVPAQVDGRNTQNGRSNDRGALDANLSISQKIKEMYANAKPAAVLAVWLGVSPRTAERKLGGHRSYSAEELAILLRSERGYEVLAAVMAGAEPSWW